MTKDSWATLKIALSGAASVGKTTLASHLAERLALPAIPELFDEGIYRGDLKKKTAADWGAELNALLEKKSALEDKHGAYISDRCALDLLHTWMFHTLHRTLDQRETKRFLDQCIWRLRNYDFVVFLPWGGLPLQQVGDDRPGISRTMNYVTQLRHQAYLVGLAHITLDKRRIIEVPTAVRKLEDRAAFVMDRIAKRQKRLMGET